MTTRAASDVLAITINGERRQARAGNSVATMLAELDLDPRLVVVERNRVILRDREALGAVQLEDGDEIEIVHFVGGG
jgi:thiazole synthase